MYIVNIIVIRAGYSCRLGHQVGVGQLEAISLAYKSSYLWLTVMEELGI